MAGILLLRLEHRNYETDHCQKSGCFAACQNSSKGVSRPAVSINLCAANDYIIGSAHKVVGKHL